MAGLKETVQIQIQDITLRLEEAGFGFGRGLQFWPNWKRKILYTLLIGLIPTFLAVRYGTELVLSYQYKQTELVAHPSYSLPSDAVVTPVSIVGTAGRTSAYVEVRNPNLELAADGIRYTFTFQNQLGQEIAKSTGITYLLPNERKYLVVPRIDSTEQIRSGTVEFEEIRWQRKLNLPEVQLITNDPRYFDEANPLTFYAEGSVVNSSPYRLNSVKLVYFVYDRTDRIVAVSQRDEFNISPFARRAYKQLWPELTASSIGRVKVYGYTNLLDPANALYEDTATSQPPTNPNSSSPF